MTLSGAEQFAAFPVGDKGWMALPRLIHKGPHVQENRGLEHNSPLNCMYSMVQSCGSEPTLELLWREAPEMHKGHTDGVGQWLLWSPDALPLHQHKCNPGSPRVIQLYSTWNSGFFLKFAVGKRHISMFDLALRGQMLLTKSIESKSLRGTFLHENLLSSDWLSCGKGWMSKETQLKTFYRDYDLFI